MKDKSENDIYMKPKREKITLSENASVEADRRITPISQPSLYKRTTHEPSLTKLAPSSLLRVGKVLIYVIVR